MFQVCVCVCVCVCVRESERARDALILYSLLLRRTGYIPMG